MDLEHILKARAGCLDRQVLLPQRVPAEISPAVHEDAIGGPQSPDYARPFSVVEHLALGSMVLNPGRSMDGEALTVEFMVERPLERLVDSDRCRPHQNEQQDPVEGALTARRAASL